MRDIAAPGRDRAVSRRRLHLDDPFAVEETQGLELAMERRALHADEGGCARDVATEARHLRDQVFALEDLAGIAQRQTHDLAALVPAHHRGRIRTDLSWQHLGPDGLAH